MTERKGPGIIWVTSYPKSGNTWMRFLLAHLLIGNIKSSADVNRYIPGVGGSPNERIKLPADKPVMLKTHWTITCSNPLFNETLGFVYLVRNPLDIMMSFFNFNLLRFMRSEKNPTEKQIAAIRSEYIDTFIGHRGNPLGGSGGGHTNWIENVRLWHTASERYPSVMVRYEDMLNDTRKEVQRVLQFFNHEVSDQKIRQAIHKSSFNSMKKQEENEVKKKQQGFFYKKKYEKAHQHGIRFMNKGASGQGFQYLSEGQRLGFLEAFGPTLEKLGYHIDPDSGELQLDAHPLGEITPLDEAPDLGYAQVQRPVMSRKPD